MAEPAPSYNWLAQGLPMLTESGLMGPPPAGTTPPLAIGALAVPQAPPPMLAIPGAPAPVAAPTPAASPAPFGPPPPPSPPPPPGPMSSPFVDDARQMSLAQPPGANMTEAPPPAPPGPPAPGPPPADVQFTLAQGGGMTKAKELHTRGPQQEALLMRSFEHPAEAATNADFRNQVMADREELEFQRQAEAAAKRQEAADQVAAKRQVEMEAMARDYDAQIRQTGQMHLDDNRWWAKKSTGDKIGTIALVLLGSVSALGSNGQNLAYNATLKEIDDDLEAQKFDYSNAMNRAKGAQNSYAMALERYGSEDAAAAASRAAALDFAAAKVGQLGAQWKGTESASSADELRARLLSERDRTAAAGLKFVPAGLAQKKYQMTVRGQTLPGLVDEKKAQEIALEHGVKPAEAADQAMLQGGIALQGKAMEAAAKRQEKLTENQVRLPNGDIVAAPDAKTAEDLRKKSVMVSETRSLVAEAKKLREAALFRGDPSARARLNQIQANLTVQFKNMAELGALSGPDYELAEKATADLFGVTGVDAQLDGVLQRSERTLRQTVDTIPGAPDTARGKISAAAAADFTPYGKK